MEESINQRICRLRKKKGYTQEFVAILLGLKTSTYSQMERKGKITADMVIKLSKLLETTTDVILFGEEMASLQQPEEKTGLPELPYQKDAYHFIIEITNDDYNFLRCFWALNKHKRLIAHQYIYDMSIERRNK